MTKNALVLLGAFVLGAAALTGLLAITSPRLPAGTSTTSPEPPRPAEPGLRIEPNKLYNVYFSFGSGAPSVYRACKLLGFTDRGLEVDEPEKADQRSSGSTSFGYSSATSRYDVPFQHWLVLQLSDNRKAFLPAQAVHYFEEAQPLVTVQGKVNLEAARPAK